MSTHPASTIRPTASGEQAAVMWFAQPEPFGRFTVPFVPRDLDLKARIAYWIREAREAAELSRPELGSAVGVGRGAVSDWEKGVSVPSLVHLGALCDALHVDADLFAHPPAIPENPISRYLRPAEVQVAERAADRAVAESRAGLLRDVSPDDAPADPVPPRRGRTRGR